MDFPILELLQDCEDPPLGPDKVARLQRELGVTFPAEYAEFLLKFNGGMFHRPVMFYVPNTDRFSEGVSIFTFLGDPEDRQKYNGLVWSAQQLTDRLPSDYLAIADCNSEDFVLLKFSEQGSRFEGVWFWDGPGFWCPEQGNNIHWLADSFNEFLSMLQYDTYYDEEQQESDPLFRAIEVGKLRVVEEHLSSGGSVEAQNSRGQSLLAAAAIYSWPKIVRLLLEHGADPNARDHRGRTPLFHAARHSIDGVKLLLAAGADVKARDSEGKNVIAGWSYRADQILRAHGAVE
jgi:hypothetical protein